ncbi:hypothetical protein SWPG_00138 [Synechococcus phage S-CBM2]|nr:hypothetical protein SWPG_00138 [Synechococcus phage S-CBM2]
MAEALVYPRTTKGNGPRDYLQITVATNAGSTKGYQFFGQGGGGQVRVKGNIATIYLAMPRNIQVSYGMSYQGVELGGMGGAMVNAASNVMNGGLDELTSQSATFADAAQNAMPEVKLGAAAGLINTMLGAAGLAGGVTPNSIAALTQGQVFNPFQEITFKGVNFRSHAFDVKMVARNAPEAEEIKKIVNTLRYHMHPELTGTAGGSLGGEEGGAGRWLSIPSYFDLAFIRMPEQSLSTISGTQGKRKVNLTAQNEIKNLYRPGTCVLERMTVNFTPDGQYVTAKGQEFVLACQMQLSFKETVMLHRKALKELGEVTGGV